MCVCVCVCVCALKHNTGSRICKENQRCASSGDVIVHHVIISESGPGFAFVGIRVRVRVEGFPSKAFSIPYGPLHLSEHRQDTDIMTVADRHA